MATEAGMEFHDADLKIGAPGKWQHFQKDFFYRLVKRDGNRKKMQAIVMFTLLFLCGSFVEVASADTHVQVGSGIGAGMTLAVAGEKPEPSTQPEVLPGQPIGGHPWEGPVVRDGDFPEKNNYSRTIGLISKSPWFGLLSGFASIVALLLTLWGSQVRPLPFSFYKSLVWRRMILLSFGGGFIVCACVTFYNQELPPPGEPFILLHTFLRGRDSIEFSGFNQIYDTGPALCIVIFIFGVTAILIALLNDPMKKIRVRLSGERRETRSLLNSELSQLFDRRSYEELSTYEKAIYRELMDYYGELQSRLLDVLLGSSMSPGYRRGLIGKTSLLEVLTSEETSRANEEKK